MFATVLKLKVVTWVVLTTTCSVFQWGEEKGSVLKVVNLHIGLEGKKKKKKNNIHDTVSCCFMHTANGPLPLESHHVVKLAPESEREGNETCCRQNLRVSSLTVKDTYRFRTRTLN